MIEKYYSFNVDAFFRDYEANFKRYTELKRNLDEEIDLSGLDFGKIKSGQIADPTALKAIKREAGKLKLKELEMYFAAYDWIVQQMSEDEKKVLEYIKADKRRKEDQSRALTRLCEALCCEKSKAYVEINAFRQKVRQIAEKGAKKR